MRFSGTQTVWLFLFMLFFILIGGMACPPDAESLTSYIDENNRFILDGEPFFPLGLYFYERQGQSFPDVDELHTIADSCFDTLMHYSTAAAGDAQNTEFLAELRSRDLKLIFSLKDYFGPCNGANTVCENPLSLNDVMDAITQKVTAFKDDPAVIAWYMNDEVCPACLDELEAGYEKIRELDDNHVVWSVHWNTAWLLEEAHTTDIVGVDPSPVGTVNPITQVSQMADEANAAGKPLWLVPQIYSRKNDPYRPPTREEMRAMSYLGVNHGAKGLIYYSYSNLADHPDDYDTRWEEIKGIASEIDVLRPIFLATQRTNDDDVVCSNNNIDYKLFRQGDAYYLFAVNTKEEMITGVSFQINMTLESSRIDVLFEVRPQPVVTNASFTDDFDAYEVHVYNWDRAQCAATWTPDLVGGVSYNVYAWWKASSNRATDAKYTIYYDGGSRTVQVNQEINGSQWNYLGNFPFAAGTSGYIVLSDDANEYVIADAVRWEAEPPASSETVTVDNVDAEFVCTWGTSPSGGYGDDYRWRAASDVVVNGGGGGGGGDDNGDSGCFIDTAVF